MAARRKRKKASSESGRGASKPGAARPGATKPGAAKRGPGAAARGGSGGSRKNPRSKRSGAPAGKPRARASGTGGEPSVELLQDHVDPAEVARLAYLRWEREGGDEVANWLAAERELAERSANRWPPKA